MDTFFNYEIFENLARFFYHLTGKEVPNTTIAISFCLFWVIIVVGIVFGIVHKNNKWRKKQLDDILNNYGDYTNWKERRLFIDTGLQTTPPNDYEEPSEAQSQDIRELGQKKKWYLRNSSIDFFIDNVFRENNSNPPYYCVLGGSGMGKSTFVVHLVRRYIKKYNKKTLPYPIKLVNCGEKTEDKDNYIIKYIDSIKDKNNTILIIDALDESNAAISNFNVFFSSLKDLICQFRIVVLTCRTQFFEKYEDEPSLLPTRDPKTKKQKQFKKYYVSPFDDYEIQHYLNKKYLLKFLAKKKAKLIVEKCGPLMARPLLLSYIDDLVNSDIKDYSISKIYEIIIDKWLEREADFAAFDNKDQYKKHLFDFSSDIALCLVQTAENNNSIEDIIDKYTSVITGKNLRGRSLLNRNSKNDYKFAHKSFMEYLVAKQLRNANPIPIESIDCVSNDMIPALFADMIASDYSEPGFEINFGEYIGWSHISDFYYSHTNTITNELLINCDISDNTLAFIAELIQQFKVSRIVINCDYDYYKMTNVLNEYSINNHYILDFQNYNFRDDNLIKLLKPLLNTKLYLINFYIKDKKTFDNGSKEVLKFLWHAQHSYPRHLSSVTIRIYITQKNRDIEYKNAFDNEKLFKNG